VSGEGFLSHALLSQGRAQGSTKRVSALNNKKLIIIYDAKTTMGITNVTHLLNKLLKRI